MNYNFFAAPDDRHLLLHFIFSATDLEVYELASSYGQAIRKFQSAEALSSAFKIEDAAEEFYFQLWSPNFGCNVEIQRVTLDPHRCQGHTFRYVSAGWGLIQLYLNGLKRNVLNYSHLSHFNERGAIAKEAVSGNNLIQRTSDWNWGAIVAASSKLKYFLHQKESVRKIGSIGVLPGAAQLFDNGVLASR